MIAEADRQGELEPGLPGAGSVLLCDKPAGITSHALVASLRREFGLRRGRRAGPTERAGHAGTLDPFATGLVVVLLGRATRLQRYLLGLPKAYLATARLGWRSSTGDPDGELTETGRIPTDLALPTGRVRQRLPMTSAVRVGGERLYRKAHRGETIETPERETVVYSARLTGRPGPDRAEFEIVCAAGTYIRTLVETLEDAYCESLRRLAIGGLALPEAGGVSQITPADALDFMPGRELDDGELAAVSQGRPVAEGKLVGDRIEAPEPAADGGTRERPVRLLHRGELVAIARLRERSLAPEVVLV